MTLLLTSFATWRSHQLSNASDDLLAIIQQEDQGNYYYLRQLEVDIEIASQKAIATIEQIQPSAIICCGMAESRDRLTIESSAIWEQSCLQTTVDLSQLVSCLADSLISDDAGKFVCEGLYYQVLNYLKLNKLTTPCIFVHVPILTETNKVVILPDFYRILDYFKPM